MISSLSIRSYIIEYNTIDANYCFGGKKFSLGFYNRRKKSGTEKIKVRGNRVVCQRFDEGFADKGEMAGNGSQENLFRAVKQLIINAGRVRDDASMPHYNPLTINELLMKWNGRRPHRPTGAPEMGGSLWFPSENGNVRRPDATTHPPFPSLSPSLDRYHRPSRN